VRYRADLFAYIKPTLLCLTFTAHEPPSQGTPLSSCYDAKALKTHTYGTCVRWSAAGGEGTTNYRSYSRNHTIGAAGKPEIAASSDPAFRGDSARYNPEELLVASLSSCQMLWYLHLCSVNGITAVGYRDDASGTMEESSDGSARFLQVDLRPVVTIAAGDRAKALALHDEAHRLCFIARSVNFPVQVRAEIV
jgi:organic hydroperoxide reductase OsmC/OhrA